MLDFIKRVAIGVAIAMCVFFLKSQVFALTVDSRIQLLQSDESTVVNTSYVSGGTLISYTPNSSNPGRIFTRLFVRFNDSFVNGGTYRLDFIYSVTNTFSSLYNGRFCPDSFYSGTGIDVLSSSCSVNGQQATVSVTLKFNQSASSATVGLVFYRPLIVNTTYGWRVVNNSWSVTDIDGTYEAITNNTEIISNAMSGISSYIDIQTTVIETIKDVLDRIDNATIGDEPANISSRSYSGTNTSGLGQNDSAGGSGLGSGGSGGYGFNFNDFTAPFAFVFARVEEFLNLNAMFLTYLINIITLGFIGLVLNR